MKIYVDIDETICYNTNIDKTQARDYNFSSPIKKNINIINKLYDSGHEIIYWTARGTGTGIDWSDVTKRQFLEWGVKFHDIKFGKPIYDLFIDDKAINSLNIKKELGDLR